MMSLHLDAAHVSTQELTKGLMSISWMPVQEEVTERSWKKPALASSRLLKHPDQRQIQLQLLNGQRLRLAVKLQSRSGNINMTLHSLHLADGRGKVHHPAIKEASDWKAHHQQLSF
ncbi:uncharacterized protein V6R79_016511 [Siganus canaliculatus]